MAIVYSRENVNYLVAENHNQGFVKRNLTNLTTDTYITNLYALNKTGLPMRQAASFPQTQMSITCTGMLIIIKHVYGRNQWKLYYFSPPPLVGEIYYGSL